MYTIKQLIIIAIIIALAAGGAGLWLGYQLSGVSLEKDTENPDLAPGIDAAYKRLVARGHADIAMPGYGYKESKIISGKVKQLTADNKIIMEVYPVNALADPNLDIRTVVINDQTKIYQQVEKTSEQMQKDNEAFNQQMKEFSDKMKESKPDRQIDPPQPPDPFGKQEIKFTDLKPDQQIMVTAKDDIHAAQEFAALEIIVNFSAQNK